MICDNSLCSECPGNAAICQICTTRATLLTDGSCVCSANSYDNEAGECVCSSGYSEIVTGVCGQCKTYVTANQV